jgi:hypothetical protein
MPLVTVGRSLVEAARGRIPPSHRVLGIRDHCVYDRGFGAAAHPLPSPEEMP